MQTPESRRARRGIAAAVLAAIVGAIAVWFLAGRGDETAPRDEAAMLVGRVLMVGFNGRDPSSPQVQGTLRLIAERRIAGVMYLRRNVRDETQVKRLNDALRAAAPDRPPLVALDQEGGRVARLGWRSRFPRTPSALRVANLGTSDEARAIYARMADGLADWGFNVNFGPVVDVHRPENPIIGRLGRAYSSDPATIIDYAGAFLDAHDAAGIATALKHFPGHGSSLADTHLRSVDVTATWSENELEPYRVLLARAPMVMTGHIVNRRFGDAHPATLSHAIVTGLLRERLGFEGVVVSDDLQMDAITDPEPVAAERALRAGVDLLLFANDGGVDPALVDRITARLAAAARRDPDFAARLREAGDRIDILRGRLSR